MAAISPEFPPPHVGGYGQKGFLKTNSSVCHSDFA